MPLTVDLRTGAGDAVRLFRASEAQWAVPLEGMESIAEAPGPHFVTDGPFLHRGADGQLLMLWSSFGAQGYTLGVARSETGTVLGPWHQDDEPLWSNNGGHGMPSDVRRRPPAGAAHAERDAPRTSGLPADRRGQRPVAASGQLQRRITQPPSTLIVWPVIQSPALEQSSSSAIRIGAYSHVT